MLRCIFVFVVIFAVFLVSYSGIVQSREITVTCPDIEGSRDISVSDLGCLDAGTKWAVVIGITNYSQSVYNTLRYPRKDAEDIHGRLSNSGLNIDSEHLRLLVDSSATKATIEGEFEWLRTSVRPEDAVFIYFSGHGYQGPDVEPMDEQDQRDEYILPFDAIS